MKYQMKSYLQIKRDFNINIAQIKNQKQTIGFMKLNQ